MQIETHQECWRLLVHLFYFIHYIYNNLFNYQLYELSFHRSKQDWHRIKTEMS